MSAKTSQLQIRVSPDEKAALKRLAQAAGQSVSSYVLSQVLPSGELELGRLMGRLGASGADVPGVLEELAEALQQVAAAELTGGIPAPGPQVAPVVANRAAALVETVANRKGVEPPAWTRDVAAVALPSFRWSLASLKPHQMRRTPVAFKRRNLFMDPSSGPAPALLAQSTPTALEGTADEELLRALDEQLRTRGLAAELYYLGGAVLSQVFAAEPGTARIEALFRPAQELQEAVRAAAAAQGVHETWVHDTVRRTLAGTGGVTTPGGPGAFVELPNLRVFEPRTEYVLALKCAAMRLGDDFREKEDLRYLLRAMNLSTADAAIAAVAPYVAERHLLPDVRARLNDLLRS